MRPSRSKFALLNWIAIYPLITFLLWLLGPALQTRPLYVETFVVSVLLVSAMNFLVMPLMLRLFDFWLRPIPRAAAPKSPADAENSPALQATAL